ncbi:MAG: hypothetical protein IT385_21315 [Deltaproteobacteria bacterium]|nr:hypothetical protein [Deltaproteobacteria bacterium]
MKTCPECGSEWAPKFKFCPEDGTPLPADAEPVAARAAVPATSPSKRPRPTPATDRRLLDIEPVVEAPAPAPRSTRPPPPKSASVPRPEPAPRPQRLVKEPPSRPSGRVQGARGEAPRDDGRATSVHEVVSRTGPTALYDAVAPTEEAPKLKRLRPAEPRRAEPDDIMASETRRAPRPEGDAVVVRAGRASPRSAPAPEPARPPEPARAPEKKIEKKPAPAKPAKKSREFSETAWFMRQPNPEDADPATGKVKVGKKAYAVEEPIPDEKRKKYTLRRSDED